MTEKQLHRLLSKQVAQATAENDKLDIDHLLSLISQHYDWADRDRRRHDHATLLMSEDLNEMNRRIRAQGEERFQSLMQNVSDALITTTEDYRIETYNRAAQQMFGYQDMSQLTLTELFGNDILRLMKNVKSVINLQQIQSEQTAVDRTGRIFPTEVSVGKMVWNGRHFLILSIRDVTERREAEAEREEYTRQLALSNAELERFAFVTSHDLQEPLRTISSFIGLLEKSLGDTLAPNQREYIDFAVEGAQRMSDMIRGLLDYSRVSGQSIHMQMHDMGELLESVKVELHAAISQSGAEISIGDMPRLRVDGAQIHRLFLNLLGNAIKFSQGKPRANVTAHQKDGVWEFAVRDYGIGIPPEQYEHLFKLFKRLHTLDQYPGTGIGLAMCQRIVLAHGGRLWIEQPVQEADSNNNAKTGAGTVFKFTLHDHNITE